jgi:glucan biosynthesis protein C
MSEKLSDASYSIYLFHQPIVLFLGMKFLDIDLNIFVEYFLVVAAALVIPFLIHFYLVKRVAVLSFLFNGTPLPLQSRSTLPAG